MLRPIAVAAALVLSVSLLGFQTEGRDQSASTLTGSGIQEPAFEFTEVVADVYVARGTGAVPAMCNAAVIVNESDVVIVDSYTTPAAAVALLEELKGITSKPVRYLINTHFHIDHTFGNQVFLRDTEIISHEVTRDVINSGGSVSGRAYGYVLDLVSNQRARLRQILDTASVPETRVRLEGRVEYSDSFFSGVASVVPSPPTQTFSDQMTLYRGDREIRILHLGRGHTGGDVIVHLPEEKVVITGDFFQPGLPYMGDAFFLDWIDSLERLKSLEFEWIIGGHGAPFQDRERIDYLQAYLRDFWAQATALYESGVAAEEAAGRFDMRAQADHYSAARNVGVHPLYALRAYELLEGIR